MQRVYPSTTDNSSTLTHVFYYSGSSQNKKKHIMTNNQGKMDSNYCTYDMHDPEKGPVWHNWETIIKATQTGTIFLVIYEENL